MTSTLKKLLAAELADANPVRTEGANTILALMRVAADVETVPLVAVEAHRAAWAAVLEEIEAAGGQMIGDDITVLAQSWLKIPRAAKALEAWSISSSLLRRGDNQRRQHGNE